MAAIELVRFDRNRGRWQVQLGRTDGLPSIAWAVQDAQHCIEGQAVVEQGDNGALPIPWFAEVQYLIDVEGRQPVSSSLHQSNL
jgi:hypothetical protein